MISVGSKWNAHDMQQFIVHSVEERDDGVWVTYGKHGQDRTYECLIGAFLQRFREHIN